MAEKARLVALVVALSCAACGGSAADGTTTPPVDASAPVDGGVAVLPPLSTPPDPAPPDCARQSYPAIVGYEPYFEMRRSSSVVTTRIGVVYGVADLIPLDDAVRWLRDLAGCEPDPQVRGAAIESLVNHGERLFARDLPLGLGETNALWPKPDLAAARAQATGSGADAGWAALHLSIYGDATDVPLFEALTKDANVFTRFSSAVGFIGIGRPDSAGPVLDAIARLPNAVGNHFYIERSLLVLRALGDKGALADLVAFLAQIEKSSEPNDASHTKTILTLLNVIAGEARPDAAAWRAWLESTGQPSVSTRR
jgi:hypothetical protein